MLSVPVETYANPIPSRNSDAPIVPTRRYLSAARADRPPSPLATSAYAASPVISRKTYMLNTSPVTLMPDSPATSSRYVA